MSDTPIYPRKLNEKPHWYALYVRARHERKVYERLVSKNIETFMPNRRVLRQWSDRKKWVEEPLFNNYIFIKIALKNRVLVLQTDGAIRLVTFASIPAVIPEWQIDAIKKILVITDEIEVLEKFLTGEEIEVQTGPFTGLRGIIKQLRGTTRLYISIEAIGRAVGVEVSRKDVKKIKDIKS